MAHAPRAHIGEEGKSITADYLVVGAGAMGLAFVDTLVAERPGVRVVLVDRHAHPGGHWNDAYPFVRLHQPARSYGVNSRKLERADSVDPVQDLSSRNEILAYYETVLEGFIRHHGVKYFPMCERAGPRMFRSLLEAGQEITVCDEATVVDATYMQVNVPSLSSGRERYAVDEGVELVPLNDLPAVSTAYEHYAVVGAGKTGIDAVLWLLNNDVDPSKILWIMPRDSWMVNREALRDSNAFLKFRKSFVGNPPPKTAHEWHQYGEPYVWMRLDAQGRPSKNKCATVSLDELDQLRQVKGGIVRLGRVLKLAVGCIVLERGEHAVPRNTLYVDCSAGGLDFRPSTPIFKDTDGSAPRSITLQSVRTCQQVFSASLIARVECLPIRSFADKNDLLTPNPHPETLEDALYAFQLDGYNFARWCQIPELATWLKSVRLNGRDATEVDAIAAAGMAAVPPRPVRLPSEVHRRDTGSKL